MCVCATAKRRRRQAKQNFNHLCPRQRPNFKRRSAEALVKHLQRVIATERRLAGMLSIACTRARMASALWP